MWYMRRIREFETLDVDIHIRIFISCSVWYHLGAGVGEL